jgi:hypothetical protein
MKKYIVKLEMRCSQNVVVKARSADEARDLAESGEGEQEEMDFGESEAVVVYEVVPK